MTIFMEMRSLDIFEIGVAGSGGIDQMRKFLKMRGKKGQKVVEKWQKSARFGQNCARFASKCAHFAISQKWDLRV
ncbi:MAG: hypothetical protein FVQ80_04815 [Planctomycetes bacterium]|nr:hypothetical protein [Planctomycetota bacterium]